MKINMKYGKWLYAVLGIACMIVSYILLPRALQQIVCASLWFYWFCVFIGKFINCVAKEKLEAEEEAERQELEQKLQELDEKTKKLKDELVGTSLGFPVDASKKD